MAKKIIIITDSCCNFTEQEQQGLGISCIASRIRVGNKVFRETDATDSFKIAQMLHQSKFTPVILHPSSDEVFQVYSLLYSEFDNVLSIHLSSHLSPTYSEAKKAQQLLYDTHIEVVDSMLAEPSLQMIIQYVSQMVSKKESFETILTELPSLKKYCQSLLITNQLSYMRTNINPSYRTGLSLFTKNPYHLFAFDNGKPRFIAKTNFNELEISFIENISPSLITKHTHVTILYGLDIEKAKVLEKVIQGKMNVASITLHPMSLSSIARYGTESFLIGFSSLPSISPSEQIDE